MMVAKTLIVIGLIALVIAAAPLILPTLVILFLVGIMLKVL